MSKHKYYDSEGHECSASQALDHDGVLRHSYRAVVPVMMRDSSFTRGLCIVDGSGRPLDLSAGNKPGYRILSNDAKHNDARKAAYEARVLADKRAGNQWKLHDKETLCPDCDGEGYDEYGTECPTCHGSGVQPDSSKGSGGYGSTNEGGYDSRTVDLKQHRQTIDRLIRDRDFADSNAWRGGKS